MNLNKYLIAKQDLETFSGNDLQQLSKFYGLQAKNKNELCWLLALKIFGQRGEMEIGRYLPNIAEHLEDIQRKIIDAGCEAEKRFHFRFLASADASDAELYKGTIDGIDIMLKRGLYEPFQYGEEDIQSRQQATLHYLGNIYEALIYKYFFNTMIINRITPNIPYYFGFNQCVYDEEGIAECNLYSELMPGGTLKEYLTEIITEGRTPDVTFWRSILFQILYTLICFQKFNIRHNDLHVGNIFYDPAMTGKVLYQVSNQKFFIDLDQSGLVKLFDMDVAGVDCNAKHLEGTDEIYSTFREELRVQSNQVAELGEQEGCNNPKLVLRVYQDLGLSSQGKTGLDLFITLCSLLYKSSYPPTLRETIFDPETKAFVLRVFGKETFMASINPKSRGYAGFPCRSIKLSRSSKLLLGVLDDPYFEPLREEISETTDEQYFLPVSAEELEIVEKEQKEKTEIISSCENEIDYVSGERWSEENLPDVKVTLWNAEDPINGPKRIVCFNSTTLNGWLTNERLMSIWIPNEQDGTMEPNGIDGGPDSQP